jgi:hypothetical protein
MQACEMYTWDGEAYLLEKYIREIYRWHISLSSVLIYVNLTERAS